MQKVPLTQQHLEAYVRTHARTLADIFHAAAVWGWLVKLRYRLGEETLGFTYGRPATARSDDTDCSGWEWSLARFTDKWGRILGLGRLLWSDGGPWHRGTADSFKRSAVPATKPYRTNDVAIQQRVKNVKAHHIVPLTRPIGDGDFETTEARKGLERGRLSEVMKRKDRRRRPDFLGVFRFPWMPDLGEITIPAIPLFRPLSYGCWGRDVRMLKVNLNRHGYHQLVASWTYWHNTERDVRDFQLKHDLPVTGNVDEATWQAILG